MSDGVNKPICFTFFLMLVSFLSACGIFSIEAEPADSYIAPTATAKQVILLTPTEIEPVAAAIQTISSTPTEAVGATDTAFIEPTPTELAVEATAGPPAPIDYDNEETGVSFSYPANWTMEEAANAFVFRKGPIMLRIGYRNVVEQVTLWTRTGIPAGDIVVLDDPVSFLGESLSKNGLVYEDNLKMVFYGGRPVCILKTDSMDFSITLEDRESDYLAVSLNDEVLAEAESILASFEVPSTAYGPSSKLLTYINPEYGFSLQYPPTWTAEEVNDEAFIAPGSRSVQVRRGTATLIIGYRLAGEESIIGGGDPAGDFESRGTVFLTDNHVPRRVLVFEGKDKGVFYGRSFFWAGGLVFAIRLHDLAQVDYEQIELSQEVQDEADLIVSSIKFPCQDG